MSGPGPTGRPLQGTGSAVSRRRFLGALGLAGAAASPAFAADQGSGARAWEVVEQRPGTGACGPCAIGNALLNGDEGARRAFHRLPGNTAQERVDALIARFGTKPSETYGLRRARYVSDAGIATGDMPFLANDLLGGAGLPAVGGEWLDQHPGEDGPGQLRRVHGWCRAALAGGLPPVVEVRAFSADSGASRPSWINLYAHWLALVDVHPPELPAKAGGFECQFADSVTGRVIPAFAYVERFRPYMATRGFTLKPDGSKDWHWLSGQPFVLLNLPDVPLAVQTRPWHERTVVALTFMLRRPAV